MSLQVTTRAAATQTGCKHIPVVALSPTSLSAQGLRRSYPPRSFFALYPCRAYPTVIQTITGL